MSARVCNPMALPEMLKLRSQSQLTRRSTQSALASLKVKRDLFGPVDRDDTKQFLDREFARQHKFFRDKWGFDFRAEKPVADHHIQWERVPPTGAPPCFTSGSGITLTRAAHVPDGGTDAERLMDERAQKANDGHTRSPSSESGTESETEGGETVPTCRNLRSSTGNRSATISPGSSPAGRKRQQKITEFLKERKKRVAPGAAEARLPAKKARQMFASAIAATQTAARISNGNVTGPQ